MALKLNAIIDGASRGNPGHASVGVLIYDESGNLLLKAHRYLGQATNNVAEYRALLICLEEARLFVNKNLAANDDGSIEISINSDSELLVKQFNGIYRIKNPALKELAAAVREYIARNKLTVHLTHVFRTETKEADRLANQVLNMRGF